MLDEDKGCSSAAGGDRTEEKDTAPQQAAFIPEGEGQGHSGETVDVSPGFISATKV